MRQKSVATSSPSERLVKSIRRATRRHHSAEEKIRIVLDGLRGEASIAELCRREGIAEASITAGRRSSWKRPCVVRSFRRKACDCWHFLSGLAAKTVRIGHNGGGDACW